MSLAWFSAVPGIVPEPAVSPGLTGVPVPDIGNWPGVVVAIGWDGVLAGIRVGLIIRLYIRKPISAVIIKKPIIKKTRLYFEKKFIKIILSNTWL